MMSTLKGFLIWRRFAEGLRGYWEDSRKDHNDLERGPLMWRGLAIGLRVFGKDSRKDYKDLKTILDLERTCKQIMRI